MATNLDATKSALVAEYRNDPQHAAGIERRLRINDTSMEFSNTSFQNIGKIGQVVEVDDEIFVQVDQYDGYAATNSQQITTSSQSFPIQDAAKWDVTIYNTDQVQTVHDIDNIVMGSALEQQSRYMTRKRFEKIADANPLQLAEVDISGGDALGVSALSQAAGDDIFTRLQSANEAIRGQGMSASDLKAAVPTKGISALVFSQYINNGTEGANGVNARGEVGMLANTRLFDSIDTPKTRKDYNATVNGAAAKGKQVLTLTSAAVAPMVNDLFTVGGIEYRVAAAGPTNVVGDYQVFLERPLEADVADATALTVSGYTHEHIVFAKGKPLSSVVQKNFSLRYNELEDLFADRYKSMTLFDSFMTVMGQRSCVLIPVKVRDY